MELKRERSLDSLKGRGAHDTLAQRRRRRLNMDSDAFAYLYNELESLREELQQLLEYCLLPFEPTCQSPHISGFLTSHAVLADAGWT